MMPALSPATWRAAHAAAVRALPVLIAKGALGHAAELAARAKVFAERGREP